MNRHDRAFIADVFGLTEGEVPDFARPTCPSCANFKAKLDREKMAKVVYHHIHGDNLDESCVYGMRNKMMNLADAIIKHLTE